VFENRQLLTDHFNSAHSDTYETEIADPFEFNPEHKLAKYQVAKRCFQEM
jgi:hypothetical protein